MKPVFVMIKCQLGGAYKVADDIMARIEQTSELYSISGQFDLMAKFYIEADADIAFVFGDQGLELGQVFFNRGVGMMVGKGAVDLGVDYKMLTGQLNDQFQQSFAGGAVAGIPGNPHGARRRMIGGNPFHIPVHQVLIFDAAFTAGIVFGDNPRALGLDILAKK